MHKPHLGVIWCEVMKHVKCLEKEWIVDIPLFLCRRRVSMENLFLFLLYIAFAFILGILSVVLKKKHTQFPDFRVGYHNKKIMENKENWDYANNVAGNLCALFAVIGIIVSVILYLLKANMNITIIIFFIYTIAAILAILVLPVKLIKK